jgi:hypothetical protein
MSRLAIRREGDLTPVGSGPRPAGHLLRIGGVPHHVGAFEVEGRDGGQESVLAEGETSFAELSDIAQGSMQTVTIGGCPDVGPVTPFQDCAP